MRIKSETEKTLFIDNKFNRAMAIIVTILGAILNIGVALILQFSIDSVIMKDTGIVKKGVLFLAAYVGIYLIFSFLNRKYTNRYIKTGLLHFQTFIFTKILYSPKMKFQDETSAKFLSAFTNDLNQIENNYLIGSLKMISNLVHFGFAITFMLIVCWYMVLPLFIIVLICLCIVIKYGQVLVNIEYDTAEHNQGFIDKVKDLLNGYIVIKSFKAEKEILSIFTKTNSDLEEKKRERRSTNDLVAILGDISSIIVNACIYVVGFILCFNGYISLGKVMAMISIANYIVSPVRIIPGLISNKKAAIKLIDRLDDETRFSPEENNFKTSEKKTLDQQIVLQDVSFGYNDDQPVLNDINIVFERGKSYAIVGSSGSGKSTIFKVLLGYQRDYKGQIFIDNINLNSLSTETLYELFSVVQQEVFLFDSSIIDNITMFKDFSEEVVDNAIVQSGLLELIDKYGKDYMCGENGKNLSGGEKQRVSIARSLIRNTPVILIDEATSALDSITAVNVENALLDIENTTKIVITHRFHETTLRRYDEIIVMNKGRIIEKGNFEELYQMKNYFYSLYNLSCET